MIQVVKMLRRFMRQLPGRIVLVFNVMGAPGLCEWYECRTDVALFAKEMSAVMDQKQAEREKSRNPQYLDESYTLEDAINGLRDKTEQLGYYATLAGAKEMLEYSKDYRDRARKTAVHLANFAMIIAAKTEKLKTGAPS